METQWYVRTAKRIRGPYFSKKLRSLAAEGKVKPDTLVSRDEQATWMAASQIKGLEFGTKKEREEQPTHVPWYEGQSTAALDKKKKYLDGGAGGFGNAPTDAEVMFARWRYSGILAVIAAGVTYTANRLLQRFGIFRLETPVASVAVRIGIPTAVLVATFAFVFWMTRNIRGGEAVITPEMSDEEIAEQLRGR